MNFLRRAFILATPERPLAIAEQLHDARWRHSNFGDLFHKDIRVKTIRAFRAAHFQVAVKTELFLGPLVSADVSGGGWQMWHASQDFRFNTRLMRVDVENQWTAIWEYGGVISPAPQREYLLPQSWHSHAL